MEFKVGRFYKTRDGRKARVICVDALNNWPLVALVLTDGSEVYFDYNLSGRRHPRDTYPTDLVAEWEDPRPRMLAYLGYDGSIIMRPSTNVDFVESSGCSRMPHLDEPEVL